MAGILAKPAGALALDDDNTQTTAPRLGNNSVTVNTTPDFEYMNPQHAMWAGLFMDAGRALSGLQPQNSGINLYMQARSANQQQKRYEEEQARQEALDKQPVQYLERTDGVYGVYRDGSVKKVEGIAGQPKERSIIKGADGYNYYQDSGERVLPSLTAAPTNSDVPSAVREYEYYASLPEDQQKIFMEVKRGNQGYLNPLQQEQLRQLQGETNSTVSDKEGKNNVALNAINTTRNLINEISGDSNLADVTGWIDGRIPGVGQGETDLVAKIDRFKSQIQLELVEKLKGTGPITENEQKILRLAGGIDRVQSPEQFKQVLRDLDKFLRVRKENITGVQPSSSTTPQSTMGQPKTDPANNSNDPLGIL